MEGKGHDVPTSGEPFGALAPTTWFGVPRVPGDYVRRTRLFRLLDRGANSPLILVSAPAGSGKTSLVADWVSLRASDEQTEWVTFEREDEAFWPGLLSGLTRLGVAVPSRSFPAGTMAVDRQLLTALAMVIANNATPFTLVLDGYELESRDVANDLDYLLRHSGRRLRIVLVTRVDPILPLYRYRLEDSLTEIRMADLAFTDAEAAELLRSAGVRLMDASIHALNTRTHGWVAGLRFASKFLDKSENPDVAVGQVAGDTGDIGEYLMGEVLAAQSPENRHLLLSTSIPATLQPGLAEVLGGRAASRMLALLARGNAFVEPVPEHPGFYRYHPFFRDLLRAELAYEAPQEMERLQRAAAEWFAGERLLAASIGHYAEIGAWAEAAGLVVDELALAPIVTGGADDSLAKTLMPIPQELRDPAACVVRAALALGQGDPERVTTELARVPDTSTAGDGRSGALSLAVAVLRSIRARASDDPHEAFELAGEAEEALTDRRRETRAEAQHELSALVFASKGIAALRRGRLSQAHDVFTDGAASAQRLGSEALLVECQGYLALIACLRDQLSEAVSLADRAVAAADDVGIRVRDRSAAPQVALALVAMERYDLNAAAKHVTLASLSDPFLGDRSPVAMLALVRSRLQAARGDLDGAISIVEQTAEGIADGTGWLAAQLRLEALHLRVATGDVAGVVLETRDLEDDYPGEVALLVAEVGLVGGDDVAAAEALSRVIGHDSRPGLQISAWLVDATRQLQIGSPAKARAAVDRSLRLAAPEGLCRPFREASPAVAKLLSDDTSLARVDKLSSLSVRVAAGTGLTPGTVLPASSDNGRTLVVEHLTEKELEVLGHLAELLTTEEIAETMFVSVNTVRTHVRNILRKLGVPRRNAAVRRARELNLLPL
jgi:LuxR family transcriptional regulator, maltose regulon positive regulatory protein